VAKLLDKKNWGLQKGGTGVACNHERRRPQIYYLDRGAGGREYVGGGGGGVVAINPPYGPKSCPVIGGKGYWGPTCCGGL